MNSPTANPRAWQKAYELANNERTGRWQWVNEHGERDEFFPGRWLEPDAICPPPKEPAHV